jgi:hypothetical protein
MPRKLNLIVKPPRAACFYENFMVKGRRFRRSLGTNDRATAEALAAKNRDALLALASDRKSENQQTLAQAGMAADSPKPPPPVALHPLTASDMRGCRFITGDPLPLRAGMFCCGPVASPGSAWCAEHRQIVLPRTIETPPPAAGNSEAVVLVDIIAAVETIGAALGLALARLTGRPSFFWRHRRIRSGSPTRPCGSTSHEGCGLALGRSR